MNLRQNGPKIRITRSGKQRKRVCGITLIQKQQVYLPARKRWVPVSAAPQSREETRHPAATRIFKPVQPKGENTNEEAPQ
jgi:hypothetical protein